MASPPDREVELRCLDLRFAATRVSDERAVARLVQSIQACGQLIACIAVGEPERCDVAAPLVLIDGYRRVAALRRLGRDTARVECWGCCRWCKSASIRWRGCGFLRVPILSLC